MVIAQQHTLLGWISQASLFWGHTQEATFGGDHDTINHKIVFFKQYKNDKFSFFKDALYTFLSDAEKALKTTDVRLLGRQSAGFRRLAVLTVLVVGRVAYLQMRSASWPVLWRTRTPCLSHTRRSRQAIGPGGDVDALYTIRSGQLLLGPVVSADPPPLATMIFLSIPAPC